jgi:hypothetical protein
MFSPEEIRKSAAEDGQTVAEPLPSRQDAVFEAPDLIFQPRTGPIFRRTFEKSRMTRSGIAEERCFVPRKAASTGRTG